VRVLSVTDHDTVAGCEPAGAACAAAGIEFVPGIEITSVVGETDVHVLGYFIDTQSASLEAFLRAQRSDRIDRVREMIARLATHGVDLDADAILEPGISDPSKSAGRPWIARALVAAGYVSDSNEAFARWLERGRPAFVPRRGALPSLVFAHIHNAGGIASLAHPVHLRQQEWIPGFTAEGLDALEAHHSDHDAATTKRYLAMAERLGVLVSGGSDYHADSAHGAAGPGSVSLPQPLYDRLKAGAAGRRAAMRATASGAGTSS
jgi:predicted metal-dependent phosphoesterase TrpH